MRLEGKIALVTGGGRGIGRGISLGLARAGADVIVNYRRDIEAARETAREILGMKRRSVPLQADVSNVEEVEEMIKRVIQDFGKLDILVNNAGIASRGNFVWNTTVDEYHRVLGVNLHSVFYCSKIALKSMREQKSGHIINISSSITLHPEAGGGPYVVARAGLEALTQVMAKEERPNNIRVNAVAPGLVETEMGRRLVRATRGLEDIKELYPSSPFGRVCQPEDIANMVVFLVSEEGSYITGQVIQVNGGGS
ncbi:MAG: 3-oxoacyl-ACP reductase FabG [Candidatus Tectomicrobia bacterium]|nr:3-oxoacyl-ACP reductase FabG [Candidatus Tectomicrobia bacterium]